MTTVSTEFAERDEENDLSHITDVNKTNKNLFVFSTLCSIIFSLKLWFQISFRYTYENLINRSTRRSMVVQHVFLDGEIESGVHMIELLCERFLGKVLREKSFASAP